MALCEVLLWLLCISHRRQRCNSSPTIVRKPLGPAESWFTSSPPDGERVWRLRPALEKMLCHGYWHGVGYKNELATKRAKLLYLEHTRSSFNKLEFCKDVNTSSAQKGDLHQPLFPTPLQLSGCLLLLQSNWWACTKAQGQHRDVGRLWPLHDTETSLAEGRNKSQVLDH